MLNMTDSVVARDLDGSISLFNKLDKLGRVENIVKKGEADLSFRLMEDMNLPFTRVVVDAVDKGEIVLVYNDTISIGGICPVYPRLNKAGKPVAIINVSTYCDKKVSNGVTSYKFRSPELLYNLLVAGFTAKRVMAESQYIYKNTFDVRMSSMEAYVKMMMSFLSRMGAANDVNVRDGVRYMLGMFFNVHMCGVGYESCKEAVANKLNIDRDIYIPIDSKHGSEPYLNFDKLLDSMGDEFKTLKKLQGAKFIELSQRLFGSPSVMAMDYLPAMAMMVMSQGKAKFAMYENTNVSRELGIELARAYADLVNRIFGR